VKEKRVKWLWIVLILVAAAGGWMLISGRSAQQYGEATTVTGSITTYYNFSGAIEVVRSATVISPAASTVTKIYVQQNDLIEEGDRLIRLDNGTTLKAELTGEVTSLGVSEGSVVTVGDTLAEVMDLTELRVDFQVDEYDVDAIALGKTAIVTVDGTGETFEGTITSLNKRATQSGDLSYYTAGIDLSDVSLPEGILPGMQVTVDVLNQHAEDVVLLSVSAVSFTTDNQPYVLMRDGDTVNQVEITVGINDGNNVEITEGLASGDIVLYEITSTDTFTMLREARQQYVQ